jgi:1-acyl-sn-glycerol-3-phosphate acyltransferase
MLSFVVLQCIGRLLLRLLTRLDVEGANRFPPSGPYLIAFNHLHWLDIPILYTVLPGQVAAFVARVWFDNPLIGRLARRFANGIPVETGVADHQAMAAARRWLEGGGLILIAPEGRRSTTGGLERGQLGAAYLSSRTRSPIVPVAIWGHEGLFPALRRGRRAVINVVVGPPIAAGDLAPKARSAELGEHTETIMRALAARLPERYRGVYRAAG